LIGAVCLLGFVTAERVTELFLANRNTYRLLRRGAIEVASSHYPLIVAMHAMWLGGLWLLVWNRPIEPGWLVPFLAAQIVRFWVLATLGERWTTRIVVLPGAPLVKAGPYRFLDHPNYVVVVAEIGLLPLVFGLFWFALLFSILNALVLTIRVTAENAALRRASNLPG